MLKAFNSLQIVTIFAGWPFLIGWLATNPFYCANILFWVSIPVYLIGFILMIMSVRVAIDEI